MSLYCVGEMVIDFLPGDVPGTYIRCAGGAPANVAIAASRMGSKTGFCGKVGQDDFGDFLCETLVTNGVKVLCTKRAVEAVTTMAFVTLHENGERTFTFARKPGADMLLSPEDILVNDIREAKIVHAGSCSLSAPEEREATKFAMITAQRFKKLVSFDVNYRHLLWKEKAEAKKRILEVLPYVDLLKISEDEVEFIAENGELSQALERFNISLCVVTLGEKGAECYWKGNKYPVDAKHVECVVDTTGAGDAFWGTFLSSLLEDGIESLEDLGNDMIKAALDKGTIAGSLCIQKKGALESLPYLKEVEEIYNARHLE